MPIPLESNHHTDATMKNFSFFSLLIAAVLTLSGCATNEITGRSQVTFGSEDSLIAETAQMYAAMKNDYAAKRALVTGPQKTRVEAITNRVIEQAVKYRPDSALWDWEVIVINSKVPNAFAMPGGKMGINTGLINMASDDEIAQVMGHEIGHALGKHGLEKRTTGMGAGLVASIGGALLGQSGVPMGQEAISLGAAGFIAAPNSRTAEAEADRFGIELAAAAGYEPKAAVTLWQKMAADGGPEQKGFLDTHPTSSERIAALNALVAPMEQLRTARTGAVAAPLAPPAKGKKPAAKPLSVVARMPAPYDWLNGPKAMRPRSNAPALQLYRAQ